MSARSQRSGWVTALSVLGGAAGVGTAAYFIQRKRVSTAIFDAVSAPSGSPPVVLKAKLTGYHPSDARTEAEKRMEGPSHDRKRRPIHTLEQHLADPVAHPYVSVAGDYTIWPDGQRIQVAAWPTAVLRVVDTGGHFFGAGKLYRVAGREPLDVAVDSRGSKVPSLVDVKIVPGDNFEKGRVVAYAKFPSQSVSGVVDAYTTDDAEALARAAASVARLGEPAMRAVAETCKNRAARLGVNIVAILPGVGPAGGERFCSTTAEPTPLSRAVADVALATPVGDAVDFWVPSEQKRFRGYDLDEHDVREWFSQVGLVPAGTVGAVELLKVRG